MNYARQEQQRQDAWATGALGGGWEFSWNLSPTIRAAAVEYFAGHRIQWHRFRDHIRSSQICCVNCLFPLGDRPDILLNLLRPVVPTAQRVVSLDTGEPRRLISFEHIGQRDYLGESNGRSRTRGANCTSADAAVLLGTPDGRVIVLIEWKYTESYSVARMRPDGRVVPRRSDERRLATYRASVWEEPWNPVNKQLAPDVGALLVEPVYQLFRQQSLAAAMEQGGEATRVVCLHLSPAGNTALHRVTSPPLAVYGADVFDVWKRMVTHPDRFRAMETQEFFAPLRRLSTDRPAWWRYAVERYPGILNE